MAFTLKVNDTPHKVDVDGDTAPLWVLRDVLGMNGTKFGCGQALCGACTVHVDGRPVRSWQTPIDSVGDSAITTIEAIGQASQRAALQKAWLEIEVVQCGYDPDGPSGVPLALFESGAILLYLADKTGRFISADPHTRYETMQWVMW
jgi:isoquinoline 1-oxidoreductase alpha subunit